MQGESLNNVATGMDIHSYRTPLGVCGGIAPFNFPVMIPLWMFPIAITCGNTYVLKVNINIILILAIRKSSRIISQTYATFRTNFSSQRSSQYGNGGKTNSG